MAISSPVETEKIVISEGALNNPYIYVTLSIFAFILLSGLLTGIHIFIAKIKKKALFPSPIVAASAFPLNKEKTAKMIFLILSFVLSLHLLGPAISKTYRITGRVNLIAFSLALNGLLQSGTVILIASFLPLSFFRLSIRLKDALLSLRFYTALLPILLLTRAAITLIMNNLGISLPINPAITMFISLENNWLLLILTAQIIIIAPIAEELLFRGVIYKTLRIKTSAGFSVLITSIIFALIHGSAADFIPLVILSVYLCVIYEKTDNLTAPILIHSFHNALTTALLFSVKLMTN